MQVTHSMSVSSFALCALNAIIACGIATGIATAQTVGSVDKVVVASGAGVADRPGTAFVDLFGAEVTLNIPAGESRVFVAQFTAISGCSDLELSNCFVRILFNGVAGDPLGWDIFDSTPETPPGGIVLQSHAMQRSKRITNTGNTPLLVPIKVQRAANGVNTAFSLDSWHLTVSSVRSCPAGVRCQ